MKSIDDVIEYLTKQRELNNRMSYLPHDKISAMARREQMAARFKPGGDKYESIKNDEAQDIIESEQERLRLLGIVDISEGEE